MSELRLLDCSKLDITPKNDNDVRVCWSNVIVNILNATVFLFPSLVTGPSFTSILLLVLELWQISFKKDWPEIRKSDISPSEFCTISGDWSKLGIPNLARIFLMKCYWMLQNARVTAYTVPELLREN